MKKLLTVVFVVAFATFTNNAFAQKFAHISSSELIQLMPELKDAQTKLEAYHKELSIQLEELQVELNRKWDAFQKVANTLSDEAREVRTKDIQDMSKRFEQKQQDAQADYERKQGELFQPVFARAQEAIKKVATQGGYIYVFDSTAQSAPIHIDEKQSVDLLPAVKKELGIN
jgi:Outer membrane protein